MCFMKGIRNGFQSIDKTTVKTVELKAPEVSTLDAQFCRDRFLEVPFLVASVSKNARLYRRISLRSKGR